MVEISKATLACGLLVPSPIPEHDITKKAIEKTIGDETHTYGVKFEQAIPELYDLLNSI